MKKGLSAWLFSKMVMLTFLLLIFSIMAGFLLILNERAYVDSASVLALQLKEATSGVANSNVVEINKMIPIPKQLPSDTSSNKRLYNIVVKQRKDGAGNPEAISFAITKNLVSEDIFVSSSLLYTNSQTNLGTGLIANSNYRFFVIKKEIDVVNFYACNKTSVTGYSECLSGGNIALLSVST